MDIQSLVQTAQVAAVASDAPAAVPVTAMWYALGMYVLAGAIALAVAALIKGMGWALRPREPMQTQVILQPIQMPAPAPAPAPPPQVILQPIHIGAQEQPADDHLPVIAAAIAMMVDEPHRVLSVRPTQTHSAWSQEGRRAHFTSHAVR